MLAPDLLAQSDPEVWDAIRRENQRQEDHVELIASENYVSRQVLAAQGSQLTNKYAEGYPGRRYYGGCEFVDIAETLAIERAKKLFGAPWANVQPHSGSQANQAAYAAVLKPGDTVLGMSLSMGGHLPARRLRSDWHGYMLPQRAHDLPFPSFTDQGRSDMNRAAIATARLASGGRP